MSDLTKKLQDYYEVNRRSNYLHEDVTPYDYSEENDHFGNVLFGNDGQGGVVGNMLESLPGLDFETATKLFDLYEHTLFEYQVASRSLERDFEQLGVYTNDEIKEMIPVLYNSSVEVEDALAVNAHISNDAWKEELLLFQGAWHPNDGHNEREYLSGETLLELYSLPTPQDALHALARLEDEAFRHFEASRGYDSEYGTYFDHIEVGDKASLIEMVAPGGVWVQESVAKDDMPIKVIPEDKKLAIGGLQNMDELISYAESLSQQQAEPTVTTSASPAAPSQAAAKEERKTGTNLGA